MKYKQYIQSNAHVISLIVASFLLFIFGLAELRNLELRNIDQLANNTQSIYEHPFVVHSAALELQVIAAKIRDENLSFLVNPTNKAGILYKNQMNTAEIDKRIKVIEKCLRNWGKSSTGSGVVSDGSPADKPTVTNTGWHLY